MPCGPSFRRVIRTLHHDAALDHLREGDVLAVWKLDRLGRSTQNVLAVVDDLTSRGIAFRSLTEGLHTDGPMGKAMLTIMAAFAQLERDTMIERTRAGLAAAAANGRKGGRPARSTTPLLPRLAACGRRASMPSTSRRCSVSPELRCIGTSPTVPCCLPNYASRGAVAIRSMCTCPAAGDICGRCTEDTRAMSTWKLEAA